jgi:hypothetical protein
MKNKWKLMLGILGLFAIIAVLVQYKYTEEDRTRIDKQVIAISINGEIVREINEDDIREKNSEEFIAYVRSSGKAPKKNTYKGVQLTELLDKEDLLNLEQVNVKGADSFWVALSKEQINIKKNVYIVYEKNGEKLKDRESGGEGPYQLVIRKDPFSQYWCKYVVEVDCIYENN